MLAKRRNLSIYGLSDAKLTLNVALSDAKLQCHGIADAILCDDHQVSAIEFKMSQEKPTKGQLFQLVTYGIIAENQYKKPCSRVFLFMGDKGKTYAYELTKEMRCKWKKLHQALKNCVESPVIPDTSATKKQCAQCEYFNFCGDRE